MTSGTELSKHASGRVATSDDSSASPPSAPAPAVQVAADLRHAVTRRVRALGPGLITGAADDDPSGIATYSQAGAAYGYGLLWTALVTFPLMAAVQLMCARLGRVAGQGLACVLRRHYPTWVLWFACALLIVANTVNIAADLGAMAAAGHLLTGIPSVWFLPPITIALLVLLAYARYARIAAIFKWLTLTLFAYVGAAFLARPNWLEVVRGTFTPHVTVTRDYVLTLVAILGTTISPYLFFWQAATEVEEDAAERATTRAPRARGLARRLRAVRDDVLTGMLVSNLVMYFIILTAGATLHRAGQTEVETAQQAASALGPLAGQAASLLFAMGLLGTGLLGVPVLAGSAAYAIAEAASWRRGMDYTPSTASKFYAVVAIGLLVGMAIDLLGVNPMRLLFWSACKRRQVS